MVNYQDGKIYKIVCNITGLVYIGSTCKHYLSQRLQNHKSEYNMFKKNGKRYISSFKVLENGNYNILLLELYPCNTKDELHAKERYYMESIDCVNLQLVGRTSKEWKKDNKDKLSEISKRHFGPQISAAVAGMSKKQTSVKLKKFVWTPSGVGFRKKFGTPTQKCIS